MHYKFILSTSITTPSVCLANLPIHFSKKFYNLLFACEVLTIRCDFTDDANDFGSSNSVNFPLSRSEAKCAGSFQFGHHGILWKLNDSVGFSRLVQLSTRSRKVPRCSKRDSTVYTEISKVGTTLCSLKASGVGAL